MQGKLVVLEKFQYESLEKHGHGGRFAWESVIGEFQFKLRVKGLDVGTAKRGPCQEVAFRKLLETIAATPFALFVPIRDYPNSFNMYNVAELASNKIRGRAFKLRQRMKNLPSRAHVLHKILNLVILHHCYLAEFGKEMYQIYNGRAGALCLSLTPDYFVMFSSP